MKRLLIICLAAFPLSIMGQQKKELTLSQLFQMLDNTPVGQTRQSIDSVYAFKQKNAVTGFLPSVNLVGQATYQTDVTAVNIPIPGFSAPEMDKDQYKIALEANQLIYDGGVIKRRRALLSTENALEQNSVQVELYGKRELVANLYFGLLQAQVAEQQVMLMIASLDKRIAELSVAQKKGVVLASTVQSIKAERLKLEQRLLQFPAQRESMWASLIAVMGDSTIVADTLMVPLVGTLSNSPVPIARPEFQSFEIQASKTHNLSDIVASSRMPQVAAFANIGYGKPGLNMLSNEWDTYALVGVRLSWRVWDWNQARNEKQQLAIQRSIISKRKETFSNAITGRAEGIRAQIDMLEKQMAMDKEIIQMLSDVEQDKASMLANGVVTSSDYVADFNAVSAAKLSLEIRKLDLALQWVLLQTVLGNNL